ncbi:methyltransferase domain-containing protein [Actinoplanes sp. LDG1-06]|uniref:Methyltransferase domain-containing protein n=1 Tax=Paractinoplanes ovalisporus TaxID=2810368 RepID=A0ABS2A8R2_9ACTN|nr:class I SAM-dependent methyltransferase [Actinoplanes ovalisporus]MBM2616230.1 methyltransferase domain-containing protein [Actinoplanes ovalisporus]
MSDEQAWDARYAESHHIWSGKPNVVLVREVSDLPVGRALDLGCGEGGDAIWLAARGWQVTAVDISGVALERARQHTAEHGVTTIDFQKRNLSAEFPDGEYDLVSAQFLHHWGEFDREAILRRAAAAVAPGGVLLIEGHMDTGPVHRPEHDDMPPLPGPDEVVKSLDLGDGWEVLLAEEHPREHVIDGVAHHRTDNTVKMRRRDG